MSTEEKAQMGYTEGAESMQLMPYTGSKPSKVMKARHDIEKIRASKVERENAKRLEEERHRA